MRNTIFAFIVIAAWTGPASGQEQSQANRTVQPLYRVEVISRTTKAINYGHRTLPTKVDFRGTVLLPDARGEARVETKRGVVEMETKFENMPPPTRFGPEYLTYVVWALTPEGRPTNLGEVVLNPSNKAKLNVSTELQAFAMIVTAEPYFSVTQPSNVVVLENALRPDTVGKVEEVDVKYELLPRGRYTYEVPRGANQTAEAEGPKLSMDEYEAVLAVYQAQNALQIAQAAGADRHAAETYQKAAQLFQQAQNYRAGRGPSRQIVMTARQAAQTAEDARAIAVKRQQEGKQ